MYKNIQKIYEIIYNIDCLICDNNEFFRDLIYINSESEYDKYQKKVIIRLNDKEVIIKDGILLKLNKFYHMLMCLENGDFESDLQMLYWFLRNHDFKFNYLDFSQEIKDIIPIRKEYGVYTKENDTSTAQLESYFKKTHYLLKDLDDL
jgi:hypothetical protein